ncbi:unnamed protein product [Polarella glacialis]|uniref:Uncharacterized protein n=1 Tax=Polarella glacialis TaxID=89957 RepID=A0A813JJ24_POLGL|nr:unnamed protein product [Polarella glacialis]
MSQVISEPSEWKLPYVCSMINGDSLELLLSTFPIPSPSNFRQAIRTAAVVGVVVELDPIVEQYFLATNISCRWWQSPTLCSIHLVYCWLIVVVVDGCSSEQQADECKAEPETAQFRAAEG